MQPKSNGMQRISQAYADNYMRWKAFLPEFCGRISGILEEDQIRFSLKTRVKSLESLSEKLSFLNSEERITESQIKDLLGIRVVVPFQEGVEQVVTSLRQHFAVDDIERKSEKLSYREFAYDAVHVEVPLDRDLGLPGCCKPVVEVQVRTILQDAWAEVEHELIYKNHFRFPNNESIRKKLAALNANLTLSDMIFQEIRDSQKEMEKWGRSRFKAMVDRAEEFEEQKLEEQKFEGQPPEVPTNAAADTSLLSMSRLPNKQAGNTDSSKQEMEKYLLSALKAHNEQDYRTAIHFYGLVLERNPELSTRSVVFNHRGMAHFMLQQESQALSDFDRSFYCDKSNYRSLNYRAMVLRRMGYVEEALECFAKSLEINASQADVYLLRAQTLSAIEQEAEAVDDLARSLELDPDNEEARQLLGRLTGDGSSPQASVG